MPRPRRRAANKRTKPYKPRAKPPETSGLSARAREIIDRTRAWRAARDVEIANVDISALGPSIEFTGPKKQNVLSRFKFQGVYEDKDDKEKNETEDDP